VLLFTTNERKLKLKKRKVLCYIDSHARLFSHENNKISRVFFKFDMPFFFFCYYIITIPKTNITLNTCIRNTKYIRKIFTELIMDGVDFHIITNE
jgi:hypothetical protein